MSTAVYDAILSDMTLCQPSDAISEEMVLGRWTSIPYETEEFGGKLIFAGPHNHAPPVRLPLTQRGWYKVYVGVHYGDVPDSIAASQSHSMDSLYQLRLKLPDDPCYHWITPERYMRHKEGEWPDRTFSYHDLVEVFWREAELDGGYIEFSPSRLEENYRHTSACVAYVRLEAMTDTEIAEARDDRVRTDTRKLIGTYDGAFWGHFPWTVEQFREFVEPLRDSDFKAIAWSTCRADTVQYGSRKFQTWEGPPTPGVKPYHNARDLHRALDAGLDPLAAMAGICKEMGIELLGNMRISSQHLPPHQEFCADPYLWSHPVNRVRLADGTPTGHLSLASPEVRSRLTDVLREQVEDYDIDGVYVKFNRSYPFVLYEEPARGDFIAEYGEDPAGLDPRDERWIAHKAKYVMGFINGVRDMLDEVGGRKGRRLKLALHVMSCLRHNRFFGLDLEPAIRQGRIDYVLPHPTFAVEIDQLEADDGYGPFNTGHYSVTPERIAEFVRVAEGSVCGIYPDIFPRRMPADEFRKRALSYYRVGADGMGFHDLYWRLHRKSEWAMLRRLGHRDEMPAWGERCESFFRKRTLVTMAGCSMDQRFNPGSSG